MTCKFSQQVYSPWFSAKEQPLTTYCYYTGVRCDGTAAEKANCPLWKKQLFV